MPSPARGEGVITSAALSHAERAGLCRGITLRDLRPIHRIPPRGEIIAAAVLVVQIVRVLPHVVAEQGALAVHDWVVLVGARLDRELAAFVDDDEYPARAEHAQAAGIEIVFQLVQT